MASSNNNELISRASPHTEKKFELISEYIKAWAQKLMNNKYCTGIIFIDCMCNSGLYHRDDGELIEGTPIRVARILRDIAGQYPYKQVQLFFNDLSSDKIALLEENLRRVVPSQKRNYSITTYSMDANALLKTMSHTFSGDNRMNYFLLYDPYDASIDWEALAPFFKYWGEVMINHMVSDPVRAITQVKKQSTIEKYEATYLTDFADLVPFGSDKTAYEARVEYIISRLKGQRRYYVAAFPFYNSNNAQVYSLIHCTSNQEGFKFYKRCAWKAFGDKSSSKVSHVDGGQFSFDENGVITTMTDESCFTVQDIAKYLQKTFAGQNKVRIERLWSVLDDHPIFPSNGYRNEVKKELVLTYGAKKETVIDPMTGKKVNVITFSDGLHI